MPLTVRDLGRRSRAEAPLRPEGAGERRSCAPDSRARYVPDRRAQVRIAVDAPGSDQALDLRFCTSPDVRLAPDF